MLKIFFDQLLSNLPSGRLVSLNIGTNWTAVVADVNGELRCGLASSMAGAFELAAEKQAGTANDLARLVHSALPAEVAVGMAAVNALLPRPAQPWADINAEEAIAEHGRGKNVALIGHFPFVPHLRPRVGQLWVLEQDPAEGDLPAEAAPEIISQADVLAITAMTLLNGTLDGLLALRRPGTFTMLLGPTTPLSPLLFETGMDIISGCVVQDVDPVVRGVMQGFNFRQLHPLGVRLVSLSRPTT